MNTTGTRHHRIVIVGGGTAGISVAARLFKTLKQPDVAMIEPSSDYYYQPLWALVGGGVFKKEITRRPERNLIPRGATWIQESVVELCPAENCVRTSEGKTIGYDYLVVAPGIQIDWGNIKGLEGSLGTGGLCSNYAYDSVGYTWESIKHFTGGEAIFTQPSTPIKCAGAPQKIMYLADDHFRKAGVRDKTRLRYMSGMGTIFSVKDYADTLNQVIARKGIETAFRHELIEVRPASREAVFKNLDMQEEEIVHYDLIHITPPMSAPDFVKRSPLAAASGPLKGWVNVDKHTLRHPEYPNVFSLGDAAGLPTSKTGAAIRKQVPVLVHNLVRAMAHEESRYDCYDGYTSCPLVTGYGRLVLAEFDYDLKRKETFPVDQTKERFSMYLLKAYGLPVLYWQGMMKGRA